MPKCRAIGKSTGERCKNEAESGRVTCGIHAQDEPHESFYQAVENGQYAEQVRKPTALELVRASFTLVRSLEHKVKTRTGGRVKGALLGKVGQLAHLHQLMVNELVRTGNPRLTWDWFRRAVKAGRYRATREAVYERQPDDSGWLKMESGDDGCFEFTHRNVIRRISLSDAYSAGRARNRNENPYRHASSTSRTT